MLKIGNLANERPSTKVNQLLYKLSQFWFPVGGSSKVTTLFILYRYELGTHSIAEIMDDTFSMLHCDPTHNCRGKKYKLDVAYS